MKNSLLEKLLLNLHRTRAAHTKTAAGSATGSVTGAAGSRSRRGFTLLEVLVASSIMIILVLVLVQLAVGSFRMYDNAVATLRTLNISRVVLDSLRQDLQGVVLPNDGNVWFQIKYDNTQSEQVGNLTESYLSARPKIMFFTSTPSRIKREDANGEGINGSGGAKTVPIPGDICAVKYDLRQRSIFEGKTTTDGSYDRLTYNLYRALLDSRATFEYAIPDITGKAFKKTTNATELKKPRCPENFWSKNKSAHKYNGKLLALDKNAKRSSRFATAYDLDEWSVYPQNFLSSDILSIDFIFYCKEVNKTNGNTKFFIYTHDKLLDGVKSSYEILKQRNEQGSYSYNNIKSIREATGVGNTDYDAFIRNGRLYFSDPTKEENQTLDFDRYLQTLEVVITCLGPTGARELGALQLAAGKSTIDSERFKEIYTKYGESYSVKINMAR